MEQDTIVEPTLWVWRVKPQFPNKEFEVFIKELKVPFRYPDYKEGVLPAINIAPHDVVLALGSAPLQELKNYGIVKKNLTIGSSSKTAYTLPCGAKCLTSYSPSIRDIDYSLYIDLLGDVKLAKRLLTTGSLKPPLLDFKWVPDLSIPLGIIEQRKASVGSSPASVDLETTGLVAYDPNTWIVTIQVSVSFDASYVIRFDQDFQPRKPSGAVTCREELLWVQIYQLLNDKAIRIRGANFKYDLMWIAEKWGILCTNFTMDTLLVGSLLDENRSNSLKTHASIYTIYGDYELDLYRNYNIAEPQNVPPDVLLPYCGYDTTVCLEVSSLMVQELKKYPDLMFFYTEILHPAARAYERVERVGVLVDRDYYMVPKPDTDIAKYIKDELADIPEKVMEKEKAKGTWEKFLAKKTEEARQAAEISMYGLKGYLEHKLAIFRMEGLRLIPGNIRAKYSDNASLTRAAMLGEFFFSKRGFNLAPQMFTPKPDKKTGLPKASTAMEHFLKFKNHPDPEVKEGKKLTRKQKDALQKAKDVRVFVGLIEQYKDIEKTLGTYVDGFLKHLRYDDRFHGTYFLFKGGDDDNGTNCFPAGELILTNHGYIPVENVKIGDKVITHTGRVSEVVDTFINGFKPVIKSTLGNGLSLRTTENHPYYLEDSSWVEASSLSIGNSVVIHSDTEVWKAIEDFPYEISSWGRVKSLHTGNIITQQIKKHGLKKHYDYGHLKVTLNRNGAQTRVGGDVKDFMVHRLMALAFLPNPKGYKEVRHLNGIPWDNTLPNLKWGSRKQNAEDSIKHGTMNRREGSQAKLSYELVESIKISNETNTFLSKKYGVSRRLIRLVKEGVRWDIKSYGEPLATFSTSEIIALEKEGITQTYGISVAGDASHVSGGIVTHNSGRVSVIDPALQTVPKNTKWAKPLRRALIAPKGFIIVNIDYSQGELRIAADLAKEEKMLWAYNEGMDLHAVTGAGLADIDIVTFMSYKGCGDKEYENIFDSNRQKAKGANFGLLYGMGAEGFRIYAETAYGVKMTLKEAEEAREKFFATYPRLIPWHDECKALAHYQKYIKAPLGRIRHLPLIDSPDRMSKSKEERRAINAQVQGCLSDMSLWSTAIMEEKGYTEKAPCILMVHDALTFYVPYNPEDDAEMLFYVREYKKIMETLPFDKVGWTPKVKFVADVQMSLGKPSKGIPPNFSDLKELKELGISLN